MTSASSRWQRFTVIVEDGGGALHLERVVSSSPDGARQAALKRVEKTCRERYSDERKFLLMTRDSFKAIWTFRGHVREA